MRNYFIFIFTIFTALALVSCEKGTINSGPEPIAVSPGSEESLLKQFREQADPGVIKVMTRNVYVGTSFDQILSATDQEMIPIYVAQAFEVLVNTDFESRARALAEEVKLIKPHLIGLQEISLIRYQSQGDFLEGNPVPATDVLYDYLEIYLNALQQAGLDYDVAVTGENIDIELPMFAGFNDDGEVILDDVRLTDYDVILARSDVKTSEAVSKRYYWELPANDLISIPSGYVAIKAQIGNQTYRFVNTHLDAGPVEDIRLGQAAELITDLAEETLPLILLGDFNTPAPENTTYQFMLNMGFNDVWLEKNQQYDCDGLTWGHDADLKNTEINFTERIDLVFYRNFDPVVGPVVILGDEYHNRTEDGLWPSDHAGIAAKLRNNKK